MAALLVFFVFLIAKRRHEDYPLSAFEERGEAEGNWACFHILFKTITFFYYYYMLEKTKSYKTWFFSVGSWGPVSAALRKLDLATPAIVGKTFWSGWGLDQAASPLLGQEAPLTAWLTVQPATPFLFPAAQASSSPWVFLAIPLYLVHFLLI